MVERQRGGWQRLRVTKKLAEGEEAKDREVNNEYSLLNKTTAQMTKSVQEEA